VGFRASASRHEAPFFILSLPCPSSDTTSVVTGASGTGFSVRSEYLFYSKYTSVLSLSSSLLLVNPLSSSVANCSFAHHFLTRILHVTRNRKSRLPFHGVSRTGHFSWRRLDQYLLSRQLQNISAKKSSRNAMWQSRGDDVTTGCDTFFLPSMMLALKFNRIHFDDVVTIVRRFSCNQYYRSTITWLY